MKKIVFLSLLINFGTHLVADITTLDFFALTAQLSTLEKRLALAPLLVPAWQNLPQQAQSAPSAIATAFKTSFASVNLSSEFVQDLLQKALKPCPTKEKIEALFTAIRKGAVDTVIKMLDETPSLLNVTNAINRTPLIHAIRWPNVNVGDKIVEELINRGACVNTQDGTGWTALMYAALDDANSNIVDLLLEKCADTTKQNSEHQTAEFIANKHGIKKIEEKIKAHIACKAPC